MKRVIYFGPPGTGKTTTLLRLLEEELRSIPIDRIAFLTFTRRARREAVERVEQVLGIKTRDLLHFRTIHSMAFRGLNLKRDEVLSKKHLDRFGSGMGLTFGESAASEMAAEGISSANSGDQMLAMENLARLRGHSIDQVYNEAHPTVDRVTFHHFVDSYRLFKQEAGLLDFTDVLSEFAKRKKTIDVDVAFIDEAQDLSALQWYAALQAVKGADRQYVAGDDDQAIYRWAGADVKVFMELQGERRVLDKSYRLPRIIHGYAQSIIHRVRNRVPKEFSPRNDEGVIKMHANAASLPLHNNGNWLLLVRNRYLLSALRGSLQQRGIVYTQHGYHSINDAERDAIYDWERLRVGKAISKAKARNVYDFLKTKTQIKHGHKMLPGVEEKREVTLQELHASHGLLATGTWFEVFKEISDWRRAYYRQLLRAHKTLKLEPTVQLETIHGAKGAEAPNVALFLEQSRRVWDESQTNPDDEARVFYVGVTRASESLHIVQPGGRWSYPMPRIGG